MHNNNFYPYGPNQQFEDDYDCYGNEYYQQEDPRTFGGFPGGPGGFPGSPGGFPGGPGGFPGSPGGPGGFPGGPGGSPGGGQAGGPPSSPPPAYVPQEQATAFAVDPGGIRRCMFRFTYIWLIDGRSFWFYPVFLGRSSVAGWRWSRRRGWVYYGMDLRQIRSFQC
ncbi:collagen-like protein [Bacillus sp. ISL-35]|uniref:hypothetical protein n=1 Tax=Bacillus sp. ISL-35 TaxID=2819122 RepID=UPI001BEAEEB6|nr:hypothetical protein [Bacillus sp. ISL-35]MBT2680250.1 collagen-like protein [Bacillus sp. ISL-35]MBT2702841.1 hypothetical protein [Chryseobacterium sp. ISL-80]